MKTRIAQSQSYVIRGYLGSISLSLMTLNHDGTWCHATREPLQFNTPHQASIWWRANNATESGMTTYWIEGPRGGRYYVSSGERMK